MTIAPCIWGPIQWTLMHLLSFNYNPKDKQYIKAHFENLGNVLPCEECRQHYNENISRSINGQTLEQSLESREKFTRFVYDLHNIVNVQTGKTTWPTFEEVVKMYEPLVSMNTCSINTCSEESTDVYCKVEFLKKNKMNAEIKDIVIGVLVIILVLLMLLFVFYKNFNKTKKRGSL